MGKSNSFGVYVIMSVLRKECYVGFTKDSFTQRWSRHRWGLRRNKHECPALQAAWNSDGEEHFVFGIVEVITDRSTTTAIEHRWMQHYRDLGLGLYNEVGNGYAPSPAAREKMRASHKGRAPTAAIESITKDWAVLTPAGQIIQVHNLSAFCRERDLTVSALRKVLIGQRPSHKGYRAPADQDGVLSGAIKPSPLRGRLADKMVCPQCGRRKDRHSAMCAVCYRAGDKFHEHLRRIARAGNLAGNKARWGRTPL